MPWHTPQTWVDAVTYDETDMNDEIRDNMGVLKFARDDAGKFLALSSAYLLNLSGANLTGIHLLGIANTISAKNLFNSGNGRFVVPAGLNLYDAAKSPGAIWTDGDYLHWIGGDGNHYRYIGTLVQASSAGIPGSLWVEGDDLHYVSANDGERLIPGIATGLHTDSAALIGSLWSETFLHWIRQTAGGGERNAQHADAAHADSHSDVAHSDTHSDVAASSSHGDIAHVDSHTDTAHNDSHTDVHADHTDVGHADSHADTHQDVAHADTHTDGAHTDSHSDVSHADSHGDSHTDSHTDTPALSSGPENLGPP